MSDIQLKLDEQGAGSFFIEEGGKRVAEMVVRVDAHNLTVYHTEVAEDLQGRGVSSELMTAMVAYVRQHGLKVIPLCPYVSAQFKRHPDQYNDIWNHDWHNG